MSQISIVPIEIALDDRLTKMQMKVLIALLSFRAKNTDTVWPKRETLKQRCGYDIRTISRVTGQLEKLGWLQKEGKGGFSKSCEYRITVPDLDGVPRETVSEVATVAEPETVASSDTLPPQDVVAPDDTGPKTVTKPETVAELATVAKPGTTTVSEVATSTVSEPDTRNKQTIEQTSEQSSSNTTRQGKFPMYLSWRPSEHVFKMPIMRTIHEDFIPEQIDPFIAFWFEREQAGDVVRFQVGQWDSKFIDSCVKRWRWAQTKGWKPENKKDFIEKVTDRSWATEGFN